MQHTQCKIWGSCGGNKGQRVTKASEEHAASIIRVDMQPKLLFYREDEGLCFSGTSVRIYQGTRSSVPDDNNFRRSSTQQTSIIKDFTLSSSSLLMSMVFPKDVVA